MLDIKKIRKNYDNLIVLFEQRGVEKSTIDHLLELDQTRRNILPKLEEQKQLRNKLSDEVAELKKSNQSSEENIENIRKINKNIKELAGELSLTEKQYTDILVNLPNLPDETVPFVQDEDDNIEVKRWSKPRQFDFHPKAHYEIGEALDILDFQRGAKVTGARFLYYKNLGARLERAIYNFMLDTHINEHGFQEMITPYMVNSKSMFGTGQFPKFKEDVFQVADTDYTLIPTAEVPLTNYYANEILSEDELPIYFTAMSPCFRSEAGSAGKDTRGLIRLHQFHKVEMVKFTTEETSYDELESLTRAGEEILEKLELPYRTIVLCTGDMGFSAAKTYDIEVWMPAQNTYREISSCSNCVDFQARRAMIRYRTKDGEIKYAHTLNGSGLAVGRTVAAIIENYQNEDGSVTIPEVLQPYMGGQSVLK